MGMNIIKRGFRGLLVSLLVSATIAGCRLGPTQNPDAGMNTPSVAMASAIHSPPTLDNTETYEWTGTPPLLTTVTQTPTETATATATPETISMELYQNVPASYEYLLAHPNEFIHAPNPIDDREAFDRWFNEELMEAIGPKSEREVNIRVNALGHSGGLYSAWSDKPTAISGIPGFFYFEYSGTVIPVMIVNVSRWDPNVVDQTFCVGLFGGSFSPTPSGTNTLQMLSNGDKFSQMDIFLSTSAELLSGIQLGDMAQSFIDSSGDAWAYLPDNVAFGLGQVYMVP